MRRLNIFLKPDTIIDKNWYNFWPQKLQIPLLSKILSFIIPVQPLICLLMLLSAFFCHPPRILLTPIWSNLMINPTIYQNVASSDNDQGPLCWVLEVTGFCTVLLRLVYSLHFHEAWLLWINILFLTSIKKVYCDLDMRTRTSSNKWR